MGQMGVLTTDWLPATAAAKKNPGDEGTEIFSWVRTILLGIQLEGQGVGVYLLTSFI